MARRTKEELKLALRRKDAQETAFIMAVMKRVDIDTFHEILTDANRSRTSAISLRVNVSTDDIVDALLREDWVE